MPALPSGASVDSDWLSAQLNLDVDALEIESLGVPQGFTSNTMSLIHKIDSDDPHSRDIALRLDCFRWVVACYRALVAA